MSIIGLLNLNKPAGVTSRRVVDQIERLQKKLKAGHAGTLDPLASGVLVLCIGPATRLIEYVQRMPKRYLGTFLLGRQSPTEDVEGEVVELDSPPIPTLEQIEDAARGLVGGIWQRPPVYSALKVKGRRAYDLARKGSEVELQPRRVVVHRIEVVGYDYPELRIEVDCGSGTYIRSLGRDLAASVGTMGVMSALVRTAIGVFRIEDAVDPDSINQENWTNYLLPPRLAVDALPQVRLDSKEVRQIQSGQAIRRTALPNETILSRETIEVAGLDEAGRLVALLVPRGPGLLGPKRVLGSER